MIGSYPTRPQITDEVQCPDCKAYRATATLLLRDPQTNKPTRPNPAVERLIGLVSLFVFGDILFSLFGSMALTCGLAISLGLAVTIGIAFQSNIRQARAIRVHRYKCLNCGYSWEWQEGTPFPHKT